jgi:glucosamine-6-phosphate deaminase
MRVTIFKDERALAKTLADRIARALADNPALVLGLPTGRTPIRLYHELGAMHAKGQADFSRATTFNLDEFVGIPPQHPGSYRAFMQEHLFSRVNLDPSRINILNGAAADARATTARSRRRAGSTCSCSASAPTATSASTNRRASSPARRIASS